MVFWHRDEANKREANTDDLNPNILSDDVTDYLDDLFEEPFEIEDQKIENKGVDKYVPEQGHTVGDGFIVHNKHRSNLFC